MSTVRTQPSLFTAGGRPPQLRAMRTQHGLGLVETLVATTIGAILLAAAVPGMKGAFERRRLDGSAAQLVADLRYARSEAFARNRPVRVSFHVDAAGSCYLIHTGPLAHCSCAGGRPACTAGAALVRGVAFDAASGIAVRANVASIAFDSLHGTATPAATVQTLAASGDTVRHVVNVLGRVRSCSPAGTVPGWHAC